MGDTVAKADSVYGLLMKLITFCELQPGSIVTEGELMELTGVGRTPLREAVQRLTWDGVMKVLPRTGIQIPPISVEHQFQLLEVRRPLEAAVVAHAATRRTASQRANLERIADLFDALTTEDGQRKYDEVLTDSHHAVVEAAHNDRFSIALSPSQALSRRFWFANMSDLSELDEGARRHIAILRAIANGEAGRAVEASGDLLDYLERFAVSTIRSRMAGASGSAAT